mmetsp:Transcript_14977/g.40219  ORF Transcript_14977/g.40219 Transcript_14977/m.40219 type:complete len:288 (+) Transcript_14977:98-961(+)
MIRTIHSLKSALRPSLLFPYSLPTMNTPAFAPSSFVTPMPARAASGAITTRTPQFVAPRMMADGPTIDVGKKKSTSLEHLLDNNRKWADRITAAEPDFFTELSKLQTPQYLWIGCSDSRVPANQIVDLPPGSVFVHRNIANVVSNTDFNCLSVMQYSIAVLKVKHVIVCGHYKCGGVAAAMTRSSLGLIDNWLRNIRDVRTKYEKRLNLLYPDEADRLARLCELNVIEQVRNVCHTTIVQEAWARGQDLTVHGWIYDLATGKIKDLGVQMTAEDKLNSVYDYEFNIE